MRRLLLEGSDIDELLERVRAEHGPDAEIVSAQERLVGGVGGFFARRRFEVSVQVPEGPATPAASTGSIPETTAAAASGAHLLSSGREHIMTAHGSATSPLASTLYDALRDAAGGGSLEDLLSVADRQDGAVPVAAGPSTTSSGAAGASASEDAVFRPAPYVPAAALQTHAQAPGQTPVRPAAQPPSQATGDPAPAPAEPRGAHRAEPADAPGFEELLRDLMQQRELALQAGINPQPVEEPVRRGRHAALPTDPAPATAPTPAPPTAPPTAPTFAPAGGPTPQPMPAPIAAQSVPATADYRPWENAAPAPAPTAVEYRARENTVPAPAPAPAPAPNSVLADPIPEPETRRRGHRRSAPAALAPAGLVALGLSPDSPVRASSPDERTVLLDLLSDVAALAPTELRGTAVIVGPTGPARAVARALLAELGLPRQALLVADCDDEDLVVADVLVGAAERCGRHGAAVVVLATGSSRQEGRAAGRLAALLGHGPLTAVVDATREAEATRSWLAALAEAGRSVDDLAAFGVTETSVPLRLLELGHPVSWLDAAPATLGAWAAPCLERLRA